MRREIDNEPAQGRADESAEQIEFEVGSGNVFADLGFENPDEELAKAHLVHAIDAEIRRRRITQRAAAALLGTEQPRISRLLRGDTTGFSIERLFRFLNALGRDVEIVVRRAAREQAVTTVRRVSGEVPAVRASASQRAAMSAADNSEAKGRRGSGRGA